jgi:hypothetical protein
VNFKQIQRFRLGLAVLIAIIAIYLFSAGHCSAQVDGPAYLPPLQANHNGQAVGWVDVTNNQYTGTNIKPDGITDDTAQLQKLISEVPHSPVALLYFPNGTYARLLDTGRGVYDLSVPGYRRPGRVM